jgi:spore coat polysaccharide biosynthesis protein SpsF (cytidylyltransferase family)/ubiquinone/menaquinone biosynthesis C-methylase UbiE
LGKTGIILQARLTSKRFPCKVLFPLFDETTVLEMMYRELLKVGVPVIIAIPDTKPNLVLEHWCKEHGMNVFIGSENDCTDRFLTCAEKEGFDTIIRICADTPLIRHDDILFSLKRFEDTKRYTEGNGCQIFSRGMLRDAHKNDPWAERREGVSCYHMGMRLDYPEDIIRIQNNMGINFMEHMRKKEGVDHNTAEIIEKAYDMQAGIAIAKEDDTEYRLYYDQIAKTIADEIIATNPYSVMEAGVGEGVIVNRLSKRFQQTPFLGLDISQKRLDLIKNKMVTTVKSRLDCIDLNNNTIDLTYTVHAIEPNGGNEEAIIKELIRVTKKKLVLIEPTYELGNKETRDNIERHHYCKGIPAILDKLKVKYDSVFLGIGKETNQNALYVVNLE